MTATNSKGAPLDRPQISMDGEGIAEKWGVRHVIPARNDALGFLEMPINPPLRASGSRELKRPRPIPRSVRDAITLMVYGRVDDENCAPVDFVEASRLAGIKPDVMRRWLDRAEVRALLLKERKAFRASVCAGNELALQRVRDKSLNHMATVAAVRQLQAIDEDDPHRRSAQESSPFMTIRIITPPAAPAVTTIEHKPIESEGDDPSDPTVRRLREPRFHDPTDPDDR